MLVPHILKLEGVSKRFGGVVAAEDVSFAIQPGKIYGLIGPNGAGKSTLMNLISGIYDCDAGRIQIDQVDVTNLPAYKRSRMGLGRTFQTPRFLQRSSILENLLLGVDLHDQYGYLKSFFGKRESDLHARLAQLMPIAGFEFGWEDDINSISYGQRKLLEIVRSMLASPKIMLVDEPAAGLNNSEINNAMELLKVAAQQYGTAVLLIEHSMEMVMNNCCHIVVLNFGKVLAQGEPAVISADPAVIEAYLGGDFHVKD